jgi:processive 1,2-diacylglycerol beta-glucosyltransferase
MPYSMRRNQSGMGRWRIHILYEHGTDLRPFGSAYIRLLLPLTHPTLDGSLDVTHGLRYNGQDADAVIVDRLWRPDISLALAEGLVADVHRADARLIYALDDDFLDLPAEGKDWQPTKELLRVVEFFLSQADGVMVTTQGLVERLAGFNPNIVVVPHALDERLLSDWGLPEGQTRITPRRKVADFARTLFRHVLNPVRPSHATPKVIGYMGTFTHDDDLVMVLPALHAACQRHEGGVEVQILGVVGRPDTLQAIKGLPVRIVGVRPGQSEYPSFMSWFSSHIRWDIAISPLTNTPFNRCKSDIKFLDYSAISAAGIYSRVPAYEASVRHLQTGWLTENDADAWVEALDELLSNDSLRIQMAQNATRYLYAERTLDKCAASWAKAIDGFLGEG